MIVDAFCLNCGKEFDGHWSKPMQGKQCPYCSSFKIIQQTDEYEGKENKDVEIESGDC